MSVEDLVSNFAKNISKKPSAGWRRADTFGEVVEDWSDCKLSRQRDIISGKLDQSQIKEHTDELLPFFEAVADEVEKIYLEKGYPKYKQVKLKTSGDGGKYTDYRSPIVRIEEEGAQDFAMDFNYRLQQDLLSRQDEWDDLRKRLAE